MIGKDYFRSVFQVYVREGLDKSLKVKKVMLCYVNFGKVRRFNSEENYAFFGVN